MTTLNILESVRRTRESAGPATLRRFRPLLSFVYQQELQALADSVAGMHDDEARDLLVEAIAEADERHSRLLSIGLRSSDLIPVLKYAAVLRVLRDLLGQGWTVRLDDEGVILDLPRQASVRVADPENEKEAQRRSLSFARDAQLAMATTRRFIKTMEQRGIGSVFADGSELARRLAESGPKAIQPCVEVITHPRARDTTTGLLLQEIWRYARLYWSIPYQSTPGRNIFFLVRDEATEERPLIGIAALGNPVLGLAQRDDFYGWSARGLAGRLSSMLDKERSRVAAHLYRVVERGFTETYADDLLVCEDGEWRDVVKALEMIEQQSAAERLDDLQIAEGAEVAEARLIREADKGIKKDPASIDWQQIAETALYRRKRAGTMADLTRAKGTFEDLGFSRHGGSFKKAFASEEGVRAIEIALRRIKQQVMATSVMELITCGAVPPYRETLGGKLVAMLMLSGEVVTAFRERYSNKVSLIASGLAGRAICREPRLALITTSSLYAVGSSQYNRIKIPVGKHNVAYKRIGMTKSFGTIHFAPDTVEHLNVAAQLADSGRRQINNVFGEGTSPKLRRIRSSLDALGLDSNTYLRHHSPRLLYGAALCSNVDDVVLGIDEKPRYVLPPGSEGTELIVEHWRYRWLARRVSRSDILERLRGQQFEDFRLSNEGSTRATDTRQAIPIAAAKGAGRKASRDGGGDHTFIECLYRSSKSYADRMSPDELEAIHVDLGVDKYLVDQAKRGLQIVVTGNPGDGKTHLIERVRSQLEAAGVTVITDANACSNNQILDAWQSCEENSMPFVLAINEWPLYVLQRQARKRKLKAVEEALRQVDKARYYVATQEPEPPQGNVIVIDLGLRNLLAPSVVERVIDRLTQERFYTGLEREDPMLKNREALRNPRVRERLCLLLEYVGTRTSHVTIRQLVGFVAFLLSGGQSATDRIKASQDAIGFSYSNLAFYGGVSPLFDAVRAVFDPVRITHPDWDDRLWRGATESNAWLGDPPHSPLTFPVSARRVAYRAIKRRFFFEHTDGADLLELVPNDEKEFRDTLRAEEEGRTGLVRDLVLALNRFYEPDCPENERERLHLWQSHRYDVRAPTTFVALHGVPHDQLRIEALLFASWVTEWLPPEQQARRNFALVASNSNRDVALLEIDRDLFLTLFEARRGLGRSSWSRTASRRVTRFIDQLTRSVAKESPVEGIRIRNVESGLDELFEIQRKPPRYRI